jgi:hypothetical protein
VGSVGLGAVVAVLAVCACAFAHELSVGRSEMSAAEAALARSAYRDAVWHARAAAEAYVPGSPWPDRAMHRLDEIARAAATRGDRDLALLAYGAMRTAALATRTLSSGGPWRSTAEDGLVRLAAPFPGSTTPPVDSSALRADLADDGLAPLWARLLLAASVVAVGSGLAGLAGASSVRGRAVAQAALVGGIVGYATVALLT